MKKNKLRCCYKIKIAEKKFDKLGGARHKKYKNFFFILFYSRLALIFFVNLQPLNAVERLVAGNIDCLRKVRATQSIAFLNGKLGATSGFKVTENNRQPSGW